MQINYMQANFYQLYYKQVKMLKLNQLKRKMELIFYFVYVVFLRYNIINIKFIQALASYKRKDPETADEIEHMENLFDALCAALLRKENRLIFLKDEGNELMYLMLKQVYTFLNI